MSFAKNLKQIRESRGLNIQKLSFECGIARETISKMEKGTYLNPTLKTMALLAKALGVKVQDLVNEKAA